MRIGSQIERDFEEQRKCWGNINAESQRNKSKYIRGKNTQAPLASPNAVQPTSLDPLANKHQLKMISLPVLLRGRYLHAMLDTGSTLFLIQESFWRQLESKEKWKPSDGQTFQLANGQVKVALGRSDWKCEAYGQRFAVT